MGDVTPVIKRVCAYCGVSLAHEGGIRAWGALYCSEECADDHEAADARDLGVRRIAREVIGQPDIEHDHVGHGAYRHEESEWADVPYEPPDLLVTDEIKRRFDALMVKYGLPPVYGTAALGSTEPRNPAA